MLGLGQKTVNKDSLFVAIDSLRLLHDVPSISIALISEDEVLWAKGFGVKNVQVEDSVDYNTLYQGASISKTVTALGVSVWFNPVGSRFIKM